MIQFQCDYLEGCHPRVLQALVESNADQAAGYGEDPICEEARDIIRRLCHAPEAAVHFFVGGTQVNRTLIAATLRPHQGAVACDTGHIAVHESGAIESSGHKVLTTPNDNGKLTAAAVDALCTAHWSEAAPDHMVQPGMVYISNPTENGTVYTREELLSLRAVCDKWKLPLYLDGARLASAMECPLCDYDYAFLAEVCDAFTFGGTKLGALFGEALVITNREMNRDFRYILKQNGGLLAKGRLLGLQFRELLKDGLYNEIGRRENEMALYIRRSLEEKGYAFLIDSPTNQQFPIFPDDLLETLKEKYSFSFWEKTDARHSCVRICTSWATRQEDVDALLADIPAAK